MKKKLSIVLAVILTVILLLTCVTSAVYAWWVGTLVEYSLPMTYRCGCGEGDNPCCCCGPSSGVSIGWYYKTRPSQYGQNYPSLPSTKAKMYDELYDHMNTNGCYTHPTICYGYGYGFVQMALEPGYDNFRYVNDMTVTDDDEDNDGFADDFEDIMEAIDNGWPVALVGNFKNVDVKSIDGTGPWPYPYGHYIAIKGYGYYKIWTYTYSHYIICTDSYSGSNELEFYWDDMVDDGLYLETITIKDEEADIEDFEWGNYPDSLATSGGDVQWTVSTGGSSVAQIDTDYYVHTHSGTRSARIYRDGSNSVYASYSKFQPDSIGFYLMKDGSAYPYIINGDGTHRLLIRITSAEMVQYYDDAGYHDTGYKIAINTWYLIELRNIDWGYATYDIYVNGDPVKTGAAMDTSSSYNGRIYYGSSAGSGKFWIDDILD